MNIIFAGTPDFAAHALTALLNDHTHHIALVLTQPDRPAGRGMQLTPSAVKTVALQHAIPLYQPATLNTDEAQRILSNTQADLMVVAAYGLILPQPILTIPTYGCINIHASLLPRWRGAAPIQRAILAGDAQTGITIMQMDAGLDTGDILLTQPLRIHDDDTAASLHDRLASCGAQALQQTLADFKRYYAQRCPQPRSGVSYADKLTRAEARIQWPFSADALARQIRAFNPFPGSYTLHDNQPIKLWHATVVPATGQPGQIIAVDDTSITVACGENALSIQILQKAGSKKMPAASFLAGYPLRVGDFFT